MKRPEDDVRLRLAQDAALTGSRPTVMVERGTGGGACWVVLCTACGPVGDVGPKHPQQSLAWRHAEYTHDGDVFREGWT